MAELHDNASHAARLERDGFTVLPRALDRELIDALRLDVERLERELAVEPAQNLFEGVRTRRVYNLLARGKVWERAVEQDRILELVQGLLGKGFLVSTVSSIAIEPGETAQPIHADDMLIPLPRPHLPLTSTVMIALTDFTEENGATRVIPGSHRREAVPEVLKPYDDAIPIAIERGGALLYNGSLWHGGGANRSGARRVGLAIGFCVGWMRQQENQQLGIPREVAKGFSPRLRKLAGYNIYKGVYGHIDKCSPVDLLDESGPRVVVGVER